MCADEQELQYYRRQADELAAENLRARHEAIALRYQLHQKSRGFAVLSELQRTISAHRQVSSIFEFSVQTINAQLEMDRTLVLAETDQPGWYRPSHWIGFRREATPRLASLSIELPQEISQGFLLVNSGTERSPTVDALCDALMLPHFVCVPVVDDRGPAALLLSGRVREDHLLFPPLDTGDVDTFQAIAGLLAATVRNLLLAETEARVEAQMVELARTGELKRFLPEAVAQGVLSGDLTSSDQLEQRDITVLFADMVGFTALSARLQPEELAVTMNRYQRELHAVAVANGGTVDKFAGDGLMVLFGAPQRLAEAGQAWAAVQTAVAMRDRVAALSVADEASEGLGDLAIRVGIDAGACTVGFFGSEHLRNYSALGTHVNLAARLQSAATPGTILCGMPTYHHVADRVVGTSRAALDLKGMPGPAEAFEITGLAAVQS